MKTGKRRNKLMDKETRQMLPVIFSLAWPTMLEQLMQTAVQYMDTGMVSVLGTRATAAVGATSTVNWLIGSTISAISIGFLAYISQSIGAGKKEQAKKDPRRHILIQCVGVTKDIRIDCYKGRLNPGMEFLLCTDGFYGLLEEEEIYQVEASKEQIKEWVQKCFQKVKRRGELDNLSCVIVKVPNKK